MDDLITVTGGTVIPGDGRTVHESANLILSDSIEGIISARTPPSGRVLPADGGLVLPGLINHHAHGLTAGPLFASGASPLEPAQVERNLDIHLVQGTTLALNVDGLALPHETLYQARDHSLNLGTATCHTPASLRAAKAADGAGLREPHWNTTVRDAVRQGALAVGEVGSGHTLGGGGQEYLYIPRAIKRATGKSITPPEARRLKEAVLGPGLEPGSADRRSVVSALRDLGLEEVLTAPETEQLITDTVMPSLKPGLESFEESLRAAARESLPCILHCARPSASTILELACSYPGVTVVAAHVNHDSFSVKEAVRWSHRLSRAGVLIDAGVFDAFGRRESTPDPEHLMALLSSGHVDMISTDYGGGHHDSLLVALREAIRRELISPAKAVSLVTGNPAHVFHRLARGRGILAPGRPGDVLVTWPDLRVRHLLVGGQVVMEEGSWTRHSPSRERQD